MQSTRSILVERIEKFISDIYFTDQNLRGRIYTLNDKNAVNLKVSERCDRISFKESTLLKYEACKVGQSFGPSWSSYWFKVDITIPDTMKGKEVHFLWNSSSEALIWRDQLPVQGLTGGTWVDKRIEYKLADNAHGGEHIELVLEMACNGMFGVGKDGLINACDPDKTFSLNMCEIAVFDRECYSLYTYLSMLHDMAKNMTSTTHNPNTTNPSVLDYTLRSNQALTVANEIINACHVDDRSTWPSCIDKAKQFFSQSNGSSAHTVTAIGHCHIDVAWLWPYAETRRKSARSFATQILYMDYYPEYKFTQSQAQLYAWTKELYPELYANMIAMAARGQFIPTGGTWVEMDGNLPSGESFVRQFLHGQRFFKSEFGSYCTEFWLPDTFGYSGQLPQIINHAQIKHFITQKLSWNNINKFPHNTFIWEGIDGSKVLTHFPPANTYNSNAELKEIIMSQNNHKNIDLSNHSLLVYGHGDGGGGPNIEMIERLIRIPNTDGIPKVQLNSVHKFFQEIEKDINKLPTWIGELYFELHRGTYTSQANCKKGNRKCEILLHDIEAISTFIDINQHKLSSSSSQFNYPNLKNLWELLLLNQFHDVLPGSSIGMVYKDASDHHATITTQVKELINNSLSYLVKQQGESSSSSTQDILVFNPTPFDLEKVIELPGHFESPQTVGNSPLASVKVPSYGYTIVNQSSFNMMSLENIAHCNVNSVDGSVLLENPFVRVLFNKEGAMTSLQCRSSNNREVIDTNEKVLNGLGNKFVVYDDIPLFWDAWDVEVYSQQKYRMGGVAVGGVNVVESGPYRVAIEFNYPSVTSKCSIKQTIYLTNNSPRIDFATTVDWHESHKFLKVEFPTTIRSMNASYDIQFGHVQRPTHKNTSWDLAKFEVSAHKWADLSEHGFGVALMNDCKYGYSIQGGVMRLSLLRSSKAPDDMADMGVHNFTYSIMPHKGDLQSGSVIKESYSLNYNFYTIPIHHHQVHQQQQEDEIDKSNKGISSIDNRSLIRINQQQQQESTTTSHSHQRQMESVIIETLKKSEDSTCYIVRVYECFGGKSRFSFTVGNSNIKQFIPCDGLEHDLVDHPPIPIGQSIDINPFQLLSFKFYI